MPEFSYVARDTKGQKVVGRRDASSSSELSGFLQSEQLIPIEITRSNRTEKKSKGFQLPAIPA
jgi:type II secretory pathway component PulF